MMKHYERLRKWSSICWADSLDLQALNRLLTDMWLDQAIIYEEQRNRIKPRPWPLHKRGCRK